jgi:hypothetical protein
VVTVGSPASAAKCAAASGSDGASGSAGGAGGAGGVRCPKGGTTIFTDDFLSDSTGDCRTTLTNWNLTGSASPANVDVFIPGGAASGQVVDLDGSANICGGDAVPTVSLKIPITVVAGRTYTASFRISTNPSPFAATLPDTNSVNVNFGTASGTFTKLASDQGTYTTETLTFVAAANGTAQLTFKEVGPADRGGITLDTVTITES